jgi:hypothetical protein
MMSAETRYHMCYRYIACDIALLGDHADSDPVRPM